MTSGNRILFLREKFGLNQVMFSKIIGVTPKTVSNWEHGKTKPYFWDDLGTIEKNMRKRK